MCHQACLYPCRQHFKSNIKSMTNQNGKKLIALYKPYQYVTTKGHRHVILFTIVQKVINKQSSKVCGLSINCWGHAIPLQIWKFSRIVSKCYSLTGSFKSWHSYAYSKRERLWHLTTKYKKEKENHNIRHDKLMSFDKSNINYNA